MTIDFSKRLYGVRAAPMWVESIAQVQPKHSAGMGERVILPDGTIWEYIGISAYACDNRDRINGWQNVTHDVLANHERTTLSL